MPSGEVKSEVRARQRALRRALVAERDLADDGVTLAAELPRLLARLGRVVATGDVVLAYESTPSEPPTGPLIRALQARGVTVLVPVTLPDFDLDWVDAADPERRRLGVAEAARADLALIPGLAASVDGTRLGQGGGCYDRVVPRLPVDAPVVVLLHPGEVVQAALPREPHDQPVDAVLTADGSHVLNRRIEPKSG